MNKSKPVLALTLAVVISAAAYWAYTVYQDKSDSSIKASGTIEATTVDISARNQGVINKLHLEEGSTVARNQLVAELSRSDLLAQRNRDAMGVLSAKDHLADLESGAREQEIEEVSANVNIARVNYNKASEDYSRSQSLYKEGAISKESLEKAEVNLELTKNQLNSATAQLNLLKAGNRPDQIAMAEAEVEKSEAVLTSSEAVLNDLRIYSPLSGTVLSRNYEEGEYVTAGALLATIADLDHLWIKVYIPTDDLPSVKLGEKVHFTISGDKTSYTGVVKQIASKGEFTPKTIQTQKERTNVVFAVKISTGNAGGKLKPGMPADVTFDRGHHND